MADETKEHESRVYYTSAGHWRPTTPGCTCKHCGKKFTGHVAKPQYCSRSCAARATAKRVKHTLRICPGCNTEWTAPPSNPSKFCSKKCLFESGEWREPQDAECGSCGQTFLARWRNTRGEYQKFCSRECSAIGLVNREKKTCANCGVSFDINQSRSHELTCGRKCASEYFLRDRHHAWAGGKVLQNERLYRRIDRDGYAARYEGEHRLVAAREVGRPIKRGEVILCIDRDNSNFAPENLFLCPDRKEFGLIRSGATEWPRASNLKAMRAGNYVRPNVIVTIHEWESGKRRETPNGKPITRHPQADEIIARRRAGATLRELAKEFGCGVSSMATALKRRL